MEMASNPFAVICETAPAMFGGDPTEVRRQASCALLGDVLWGMWAQVPVTMEDFGEVFGPKWRHPPKTFWADWVDGKQTLLMV
jgi:hypothetical protein